jgi:general secretion pathway protein G
MKLLFRHHSNNCMGTLESARKLSRSNRPRRGDQGFTLIELIVATIILLVLTSMALPMARLTIKRDKEKELRHDLWQMRDAIDRYKDAADRQAFQTKVDSQGYPPDLETLVKGVDVQGKKVRFLRKIPVDPMTGNTDWGLRSMQDDPQSDSWGGQNVFDVYTKSLGEGLDGTKYKDW